MNEMSYGPGIRRCNSELLNCKETFERVEKRLQMCLQNIPTEWNPHQRLDYMKIEVRKELLREGRIAARKEKNELDYNNQEIDMLNKQMHKILLEINATKDKQSTKEFNVVLATSVYVKLRGFFL